MVEWSCANKKIELMKTQIFGRMVVQKGKINERKSYIFAQWSFVNDRNKSMATLNFGRMVVHLRKNKLMRILNFGRNGLVQIK